MIRLLALVCAAMALLAPTARAAEAGFVMLGGTIYTAARERPVEALVVRDGKIVYAGLAVAARRISVGLKEIDLKGAVAFPGFVDSHVHLTGVGLREMTLNLDQAASLAELVAAVKAWDAAHPGAEPLTGRGWIETHWPEKRFPTRADLDTVSTTRPIVLERADGHAVVLNSAALRLAGIAATTVLIEPKLPPLSYERRKEALARGTALYAARGWTRAVNMSTSAEDVKALVALAAEGRLPIRVDIFMTPEDSAEVLTRGPYADPTGLVRVRGVKLYMDGALGSRGAALLKPYSDRPDTSGLLIADHDATVAILKRALASKAQVALHAIGDRGNRLAIDWMYEVLLADPPSAAQVTWRIEHAQVIDPIDIPRLAKLGVVASMQPSHAIGDLYFAPARLGPDRLAGAYAWKSLLEAGVPVVFGTDAPVEVGDPRIEFYAAVARKDLKGRSDPDWNPGEALSRTDALAALSTSGAAVVADPGPPTGHGPGPADITVFSADILTLPEADILTVKPLLTIVGGNIVHDGRQTRN